jgi:sugar lactone lactonase YvrE
MEHRSRAASLLKNHTHSANAEGKRIGKILLPERCSNLCFSDLRKNRLLFMAAGQLHRAVWRAVDCKGPRPVRCSD